MFLGGYLVKWITKGLCLLAVAAFALSTPTAKAADDPDYLTVGAGWFDFNRQKDQGGSFSLEYKSDYKLWELKPFATMNVATNGMTFIGAGVLMDVYFGRRWVVTPSFAPTWWQGKTDDLDMGHAVEFRSQVEIAYRFDDRTRVGLSVAHYSNASLGDTNPGTETVMLNYSIPFSKIRKKFD